jgi:hypothetical protein
MMPPGPLAFNPRRPRPSPVEARTSTERGEVGSSTRVPRGRRPRAEGGWALLTKWRKWAASAVSTGGRRSPGACKCNSRSKPQDLLGADDRARRRSGATSRSRNAMAVSSPGEGRRVHRLARPRWQALPALASACRSLNLSPGARRRGRELILRQGFAGAEGKDDRAP